MHTKRSLLRIARPAALGFIVAAAASSTLWAQMSTPEAPAVSAPSLLATSSAPATFSSSNTSEFAYSSSAGATELVKAESFLSNSSQPPPRRRYGRPNYSDSHTNPDGSSKLAFVVGGGMSVPTGDTHTYLTPSYAFQVGAGRNFSKMLGVLFQFDYDHFGFQGTTLGAQQALYNSGCTPTLVFQNICSLITGLDGTSHVWSFAVQPIVNFYGSGSTGMYVTGGVGFYHKTANFTIPTVGTYCDYYYGCYQYSANQTIDKYTSNAPGFNGGLGLTYKPSRFASEKFFLEARYVFVANQSRAYSPTNNNFYPPNANQTGYVPITFGLRW